MPAAIPLIAAVVGGAATIYASRKQERAMRAATDENMRQARMQEQRALKAERQGEEAMARANQKKPNAGTIPSAAQQAARGGVGGTMLTGPGGLDISQLSLGKTSLLGS